VAVAGNELSIPLATVNQIMKMEEAEAVQFLESLLGKTLHVTVPDGTMALNQLRLAVG
jgi:hypothetical protein